MGSRGGLWTRSSDPNPGGGGSPSLAFLNKAEMAAYASGGLLKGTLATVLTVERPWFLDPSSTLAPDVDAGNPIGRTIVAANGPGNWLADRQFCSLRWKLQAAWVIDPVNPAASDENPGTVLLPLFSVDELVDRLGGRAPFLDPAGYDVLIASAVTTDVTLDLRAFRALFHGPLTPLPFAAAPSAAVTGAVDWNDGTQTLGTITVAALPVSWTASGMLHRLAIVQGGPRAGTRFMIMQDMGAKTARISQPQAVEFSELPSTVAIGDEIQVYDLTQLGATVSNLCAGAVGQRIRFQYLQLGDAVADSVRLQLGATEFDSCIVHGLSASGGADVRSFNGQHSSGCLADRGAAVHLSNGFAPDSGARAADGGALFLDRFASYRTIRADGGGCVFGEGTDPSWICAVATAPLVAWRVLPGALVDVYSTPTRVWGDAVSTAIIIDGQGRWVFDHAKPPVFAGAATDVVLGVMAPLTFAQLPYTSPLDQASMVEGNAPDGTEDQYVKLTVDTGGLPAGPAVLLSLPFTVNGLRRTQVDITWSGQLGAGSTVIVRLGIDGVVIPSLTDIRGGGAYLGGFEGGSIRHAAALAAGAHTADIIVTVVGGFSIGAAPATNEGQATITVNELRG